jgi:adenylate cyclase
VVGESIIGVMQVDSPFHSGSFNEQDLDLLTALANFAAVAVERLRNAKRAEFERAARGRLERYHSPGVVESIVQAEEGAIGGVKSAEVTVLFADLAGFTALSERLSPEEISAILEGYFTHAVEAIFEEGGTLDKFIGDCVMAFFGAPVAQPDHAKRAVRAAIKILRELDAWNEARTAKEQPTLSMRIAINTGPVVVGDVGSNKRVDYTVLGNAVNVAARLEAYVGDATEITIGAETNRQLEGEFPTESLGEFQLKGLQKKIEAFRVIRERGN